MPCNYSKYPPNWKTEIRPAILKRAKNRCEFCGVENYKWIFRGYLNGITQKEVYHDSDGGVYDADNSVLLYTNINAIIHPLSGNEDQQAIKVVLTIAHLDHDVTNNDHSNLKALCQRCHNRYDAPFRKANREAKKNQLKLKL